MAKKKIVDDRAVLEGQKQEKEKLRALALKVRNRKDLESRWAIFHQTRVEYFKGKDFVSLLRNNADVKALFVPELGKDASKTEEAVGNFFIEKKLIIRCDRVVKTVRPGKKKLSKWPTRIQLCPDQTFSEDDTFFAWAFERKRPLWQKSLSYAIPVVTIGCCLVPTFPLEWKLGLLYLWVAFFGVFCPLFTFFRFLAFAFLWVLTGRYHWFFPHILARAREASWKKRFRFLPEKRTEDDDPPVTIKRRVITVILVVVSFWLLFKYQKEIYDAFWAALLWTPKKLGYDTRPKRYRPRPMRPRSLG